MSALIHNELTLPSSRAKRPLALAVLFGMTLLVSGCPRSTVPPPSQPTQPDQNSSGGGGGQGNPQPQPPPPPVTPTPLPPPPKKPDPTTAPPGTPACVIVPHVGPPATFVALAPMPGSAVANGGTFDGVAIHGNIDGGNPNNRLVLRNCEVHGSIAWGGGLVMENCTVDGGVYQVEAWAPTWDQDPSPNKWTITHSYLRGDNSGQGLRPDGKVHYDTQHSREILVEDSIIEIGQSTGTMHAESMQSLGGRNHTFRRVIFRNRGVFNGTQTAVVSSYAANVLYEDSAFLAAPVTAPDLPATGHYTIYATEKTRFHRNVIQRGVTGMFFPEHVAAGNIIDMGGNRDDTCKPITLP